MMWVDWPSIEEHAQLMHTSNPDRPAYDPRGLTKAATLDPVPGAIEGYLTDSGELVQIAEAILPRVRISWEAWRTGDYKREATVEFPAIDVTCGEGWQHADDTLDAVDRLSREHVRRMTYRDKEHANAE